MRPALPSAPFALAALLALGAPAAQAGTLSCDVVVAGGSTAALTAALTSAREGVKTCLLEPTDWAGGQMTAGGVPAIDYAWHSVGTYKVGDIAKQPANLPPELVNWMDKLGLSSTTCWVSKHCYEPLRLLDLAIKPAIANEPNLTVLYSTVVKRVQKNGARISELTAIKRTGWSGIAWGGYDRNLSADMADWYSETASGRYTKEVITITSSRPGGLVVVDGTELGDVLALSQAAWMQGVEVMDGSIVTRNDRCGQAMVFPFVMRYNGSAVADNAPPVSPSHPEFYGMGSSSWDRIWRYRRLKGSSTDVAQVGDLSLQNWNPGNDYGYGYLFKSRADTLAEIANWQGGVDYAQMAEAEKHAYGWFRWYKAREPRGRGSWLNLALPVFGTGHGLSKFPYLRDTRRSIGLDNFVLNASHLKGPSGAYTGTAFADRVATGAYNLDIHPMQTCTLPGYVYQSHDTLPFFIPLRALTNRDVPNLLVAGKTMAQSFLANAAIRLQPIEFSSGIGAGAAAAVMVKNGSSDTRWALQNVGLVQTAARRYTPINWTINGVLHPRAGEAVPVNTTQAFCPPGAQADRTLGFCVDAQNAYGPFTRAMVDQCRATGGGPACDETMNFTIDGRTVAMPRWSLMYAADLRGGGSCMAGSQRDTKYPAHCVELASQSRSGVKEIYGPFPASKIQACLSNNGGDACYGNRWSYAFFDSLN